MEECFKMARSRLTWGGHVGDEKHMKKADTQKVQGTEGQEYRNCDGGLLKK